MASPAHYLEAVARDGGFVWRVYHYDQADREVEDQTSEESYSTAKGAMAAGSDWLKDQAYDVEAVTKDA